jgi:hypothetical protein
VYQTWWFWTLAGLVVAGAGASIAVVVSSKSSSANQTYPFNFEASLPQR